MRRYQQHIRAAWPLVLLSLSDPKLLQRPTNSADISMLVQAPRRGSRTLSSCAPDSGPSAEGSDTKASICRHPLSHVDIDKSRQVEPFLGREFTCCWFRAGHKRQSLGFRLWKSISVPVHPIPCLRAEGLTQVTSGSSSAHVKSKTRLPSTTSISHVILVRNLELGSSLEAAKMRIQAISERKSIQELNATLNHYQVSLFAAEIWHACEVR